MERILLRNGIPEPMPRIEGTYPVSYTHLTLPTKLEV